MRWMFVCLVAASTWTAAVLPAAARDIFVDNVAGDDRFTGHETISGPDGTGPVRSIGRALELAHQGDRIVLKNSGVPYRESISLAGLDHSGGGLGHFMIRGNNAVLDGSVPVPDDAWEHYRGAVFRFRPKYLEHQRLFFQGKPLGQVAADRESAVPPELKPLQWCLHHQYIYFCCERGKLPPSYELSYAGRRVGITLFHVENVAILDLTVQGFQLDGVNAHNSARNVYLGGVTCRGNGRSGAAVGGASVVRLDGCRLGDNGRMQVLTLPYSVTYLTNTLVLANTGPAWVDRGGKGELIHDGGLLQGGAAELPEPKVGP